jgi:hypothetical protein
MCRPSGPYCFVYAFDPDLTVGAISFRPLGPGITGVAATREAGGSISLG